MAGIASCYLPRPEILNHGNREAEASEPFISPIIFSFLNTDFTDKISDILDLISGISVRRGI